ncbi:hypothetical protein Aduo_009356 [Ancylostoma duodenale]
MSDIMVNKESALIMNGELRNVTCDKFLPITNKCMTTTTHDAAHYSHESQRKNTEEPMSDPDYFEQMTDGLKTHSESMDEDHDLVFENISSDEGDARDNNEEINDETRVGQHYSGACPEVTDGDERYNIVRHGGLCKHCLDHCPPDKCKFKQRRCWYCERIRGTIVEDLMPDDGGHHRALCNVPNAGNTLRRRIEDIRRQLNG